MQVVLDSASEKGGIIKVAPFVKHGKIPKNINSEIKEKWDFLKEAATLMISLEQKKNLPDEKDIQIFERLTERTHFDTEWQKLLMTPIIEHLANTNIEDIDLGLRKSLSENYGKLAILVYSYSEKDIPFHLDEKNIKEPISKNIGLLNREIKSINNGRNRKKRASKILKKIKDISKNINSINNNIDLLNDLSSIIKNIEETPGFIEKLSDEAFKDYEDIYDNLKKLISSDLAQNLPLMRIDNHIRAITNSQKELSDAQIYKRLTLITPPLPLNSMENLQTAVYLSKRLNTLKQNINIKNEQKEVLLACEEILWSQSIEFITNQMNSPNLPKEESNRLLELLSELLSSKSSLSYDILPKIRFIIKNINKKNIRNYKFTQKALTSISKNIKINNETKTNERAEVYCFLHQQQLELIKSLNKLLEEESKQSPINTNTTIEIMELLSEVTGMKESYEDKQPQNPLQAFQNSQPLRDEFIEKATSEDFDKNTARDNIGEAVTKTVELIKEIKNKILNEVTDEKTKILSPIRTLSYNIHVNQTKTLFASFGLSPLKYIGSFEEEKIEQEIQEYFTGFITKCDEYISEKNKSLILLEEKIEQETQEYFTGFIKKCDEDTSEKKKNLISLKEINTKLNLLYFFHENSGKYVLSETQLMVLKIIQNKIIDSFEENDTLEDKEAIKEISDKWNKILNPS
ncbi:MAG: hypothetical protein CMO81_08240 [Waddliaceae bacterium]|nr:hypothetical protein [Waddliaceae bacterium]